MINRIKSLALAALFVGATSAYAASYTLSVPNSDLSGHAGPYGTVLVTLNTPTTATISFTADPGFVFQSNGAVAANINATSFTVGSIVATNSGTGFTPGPVTQDVAGNEDGFGVMNLILDSFDGYTHGANFISFLVTDTSGTWASDTSVLHMNADGTLAAAHIGICGSTPCNASNNSGVTGYVGNGGSVPQPPVPEPSSLVLLGTGIVSVAAAIRRRFSLAS